jgi:hypothetical protein
MGPTEQISYFYLMTEAETDIEILCSSKENETMENVQCHKLSDGD